MPPAYDTTTIAKKYHDAIVDWQQKNFPELHLLLDNWSKHFGAQQPFALVAKIGRTSDEIEVGQFKGRPKFQRAGDMKGNMFFTARDIMKAQCSTELGSIQQHRMSLEAALSDESKFAILRVMAEELRHAYQCFWVLEHDPTWKKPGYGDVAAETIEQLLAMQTGDHVLDAFNIPFYRFLDNLMFTAVIDLVGKYQLDMQRVFSYAPVARSMGPMFSEEGFHLGTGRRFVKEIAANAARGEGDYSVDDVQRSLNEWWPRGLEMFGNEEGGTTAVYFGFKTKANGESQAEYMREVAGVVEDWNTAIVAARKPGLAPAEARDLVRKVTAARDEVDLIRPEHLLRLPDKKFFRRRGPEGIVLRPYDRDGNLMTRGGRPIPRAEYADYLKGHLPAYYLESPDWRLHQDAYARREAGDGSGMAATGW